MLFLPPELSNTLLWLPDFFDYTLYFLCRKLSKLWFLLRSIVIWRSVSWFELECSPRWVTMFLSSRLVFFLIYNLLSSTDPLVNLPYLYLDVLSLTAATQFCAFFIGLVECVFSPTLISLSCTTKSSSILFYFDTSNFWSAFIKAFIFGID
jgi:hypothetical protein